MCTRPPSSRERHAAATLYGARHVGAMAVIAAKTGDQQEQYALALRSGGVEMLTLSVIALVSGVAYLVWGEYAARRG